MNQNSPLSLDETQTLRTTKETINKHWETFKNDITTKLNPKKILDELPDDFPDELPNDFTQLSQDQKNIVRKAIQATESTTHPTELKEMRTALKERLDIYHKYGSKIDTPNEADTESGSIKLAKYMSNEIRTQTTRKFLTRRYEV